jgi:hypothetical protein
MSKAGKPKMQTPSDKTEAAKVRLQYVLDRAINLIHDGSSSYAVRARRAAKRGVPKATALKGLDAMRETLEDAREAIERAYEPAGKREKTASRVSLLD